MDFLLIVIFLGISLISYIYMITNFNKYSKIKSNKDLSGFEVARKILDRHELNDVYVTAISGKYNDHYNSSRKVVKLSKRVFNDSSITSVGIVAFECGHALLDYNKDKMFEIREMFANIAKYLSYFGYILVIAGLFLDIRSAILLGIIFEIVTLLFHLVTIKVEFIAARIALDELLEISGISMDENESVKSVLAACAYKKLTFIINNIMEVGSFIYNFGSGK